MNARREGKRRWRRPSVASVGLPEPALLLACSPSAPVDCFPHTGLHYCTQRGCKCTGVPGTC